MAKSAEAKGFGGGAVTYRIRDWGISRQRFWGAPIPVVYCETCGMVPVPEKDLPVMLPDKAEFTGTGESPLKSVPEFVNTTCPKCGRPATRETDTMDTFVDSSWYFFRYCDPHNETAAFDPAIAAKWTPVDQYIGGDSHAVMHLIYTRFWTKVMRDLGLVKFNEPVKRLLTQGMVTNLVAGTNEWKAMSKSLGNGVDPDEMIEAYGADATRLFVLFAAPVENELRWSETGIEGAVRFLRRVWVMVHRWRERFDTASQGEFTAEAFAAREAIEALVIMLAPFSPHVAEEMWEGLGHAGGLLKSAKWPSADADLARKDELEIPVQVNGKLRSKVIVAPDIAEADLRAMVLADSKVQTFIDGHEVVKVIVVPQRLVNVVVK